jgi:TonB family protein
MFRAAFLMLLLAASAFAQKKPIVFNHSAAGDTPLDRALKSTYANTFAVTDISFPEGYTPPRPTTGNLPHTATNPQGEPLEGYVLVAYIVTAEGRAAHPVVLKSTDDALSRTALDAMKDWQFLPGTVKGTPVATTAAQEFVFKVEKSGMETTNIAFYQSEEILKERVPGRGHLADWIGKIQAAATARLAPITTPGTLAIVAVTRPDGRVRVWILNSSLPSPTRAALRRELEGIPPVVVKNGPVAFALCGQIAGGPEGTEIPPLPDTWKTAAKNMPQPVQFPDAILDAVWTQD